MRNTFTTSPATALSHPATRRMRPVWGRIGLGLLLAASACKATPEESFKRGIQFENGEGVVKDEARAVALYSTACDAGHAQACASLAAMYEVGRGEPVNDARAISLYTKACDRGYAEGKLYAEGRGVGKDEARAAAVYTKACNAGELDGCSLLGGLFLEGRGMARDEARAVALFTKGCNGGDVIGCFNLGHLYLEGRGVDKADYRAAALFKKVCNGGKTGHEPTADLSKATEYSSRAHALSCFEAGMAYLKGHGVPRSPELATEYFRGACNEGWGPACFNLGVVLREHGMTNPAQEAFDRGCKLGDQGSCAKARK